MNRTHRAIAALGSLGVAGAVALGTAAPAEASNPTLQIRNGKGTVVAKAWYVDRTDTLCVRSYVKGTMATARIGPLDQAPSHSVNDAGWAKPSHCTGNLSIPEDRRYWLNLAFTTTSKDTTFYT